MGQRLAENGKAEQKGNERESWITANKVKCEVEIVWKTVMDTQY